MKKFRAAALLCFAGCAAFASPVMYTFTATAGSDAHSQTFKMMTSDFLPVGGSLISFRADDPTVLTCSPCVAPPVNALHFLRSGSDDLLQFVDANGTNYLYDFAAGAFSNLGTFTTKVMINSPAGTLSVTATPEPSSVALVLAGCASLLAYSRRRRAS